MIQKLEITRFKSIKSLTLDCSKINIFIGEPGVGKSNILESLGMLSFLYYQKFVDDPRQFVRFERTGNLFYDEVLDEPLQIKCDDIALTLMFAGGRFEGRCDQGDDTLVAFQGDHVRFRTTSSANEALSPFKIYRFGQPETLDRLNTDFLLPPLGDNLVSLLLGDRELLSVVSQPFISLGLRLNIRPQEGKIEVAKEVESVFVSYPWSVVSDTLQRIVFYLAAILTNKRSVLIFEEPESKAFPYHTKQLAELIALDEQDNQYFISTHNPYLLLPILEKVPKEEISVNITYFDHYETKIRKLTSQELEELAEIDVFSNLDRYLQTQ